MNKRKVQGVDEIGVLPEPHRIKRTPLPPRLAYDVAEDVVPAGPAGASGKLQHLAHLQDFLHNSQKIDLADPSFVTSSTSEEIMARINDLRYRLEMLGALSKVLTEELQQFEHLLAARNAAPAPDEVAAR